MPYITDENDFIELTSEQADRLYQLHWKAYVLRMDVDELRKEQNVIAPDSSDYIFICYGLRQTKLYKEILI